MLNIRGVDEKLWVNEHEYQGGSFKTYAISVSSKDRNTGKWTNKAIKVKFSQKVSIPENLQSGDKFDFDGFLTLEKYTSREGAEVTSHIIMVTNASFNGMPLGYEEADVDADSFTSAEEDLPF